MVVVVVAVVVVLVPDDDADDESPAAVDVDVESHDAAQTLLQQVIPVSQRPILTASL